jgi:hypothetical protein
MKKKAWSLLLGLGLILAVGCTKYPPDSERLLEDMAVFTQYDVNCNFNQYGTFYISDTVGVITDKDSTRVVNGNTKLVVNTIITNMKSRGFTQVTSSKNADLAINVFYFENVHVNAYYPGWYWAYPGYWWGYGYDYYYPYYPAYYTSYTSGTVGWDMGDLKNKQANNKVYIRWNAYIRGLLTGTHTSTDITNAINTAFNQTPQIKTAGK